MRGRSSSRNERQSANSPEYTLVFIRRVHKLIGMGYRRLKTVEHAVSDEEEITGCLADAVDAVLDNQGSPDWVKFFSIHEEPRVKDRRRKGKHRRRLDIRVDSSEYRPRSRFAFEAKRLGRGNTAAVYLGKDGLRRFVDGHYASNDPHAGMLAYIQEKTTEVWIEAIADAIDNDASLLQLIPDGRWQRVYISDELESTFMTKHDRTATRSNITIYHTFLVLY